MRKQLLFFVLLSLLCLVKIEAQTISINLERDVKNSESIEVAGAKIDFAITSGGNEETRINATITNRQLDEYLMIFSNDLDEKTLKKNDPKIVFAKTFPGDKGRRRVIGCKDVRYKLTIDPLASTTISFSVPNDQPTDFTLPLYVITSDSKKLLGKSVGNEKYTITKEEFYVFRVTVKTWDYNNPQYLTIVNQINNLVDSLEQKKICSHKLHAQTTDQQIDQYKQQIQNIKDKIMEIIGENRWMSKDKPYLAYYDQIKRLDEIDLNKYIVDNACDHQAQREKKKPPVSTPPHTQEPGGTAIPNPHTCKYCSLSEAEIYHELDKVYQLLDIGRITKQQAIAQASAIYDCYTQKPRRSSKLATKIINLYNSITQ